MLLRFSVFLLLMVGAYFKLEAQSVFSKNVQVRYIDMTLIEMLIDLEKQSGVAFYYDPSVLPYYKLSFDFGSLTLYEALTKMVANQNVTFLAKGEEGIMIVKKGKVTREYIEKVIRRVDSGQMELPDFLKPYQLVIEVGQSSSSSKLPVPVSLRFLDKQSLEGLVGLSIQFNVMPEGVKPEDLQTKAVSDVNGKAVFSLAPGKYFGIGKMLGYRDLELTLNVLGAGIAEISMEQRLQNLQEVVVQGNKQSDQVRNGVTGIETLSTREMKELPTFGGEADVVKSLSILPGVSNQGEGTSGFSVRGGNVDQNLVLQGSLPFLNSSHALGFYSVFNPDVVGNITLYKGDIPARYGGKLSSVLDVELKTPDFSGWKGQLSASTIAGKVSAEGPIVKNKLAVVAGVRRSYSDWLLKTAKLPDVKQSSAWFGDVVTKLQWRISERTSVVAEGLYASDFFRYSRSFGYDWTTLAGGITLKQAFSTKLFLEGHYGISNLENNYFDEEIGRQFKLKGGMDIRKGHAHAKYVASENCTILTGIQYWNSIGKEQNLEPRGNSVLMSKNAQGAQGSEWAVFAEGDIKLANGKLGIKPGLRFVQYHQYGPGYRQNYEPGVIDQNRVIDSTFYGSNEPMASYQSLEPRFALSYQLTEQSAVKLSYNRIQQFVHLISNTIGATPADVWQPSTQYIEPQIADNFAIGFAQNLNQSKTELNIEAFYKLTDRVPTYRDFAELLLNDHLETEIIHGEMKSYGAELSMRENKGRFSYQASYTWSRVFQRAVSPDPVLSINEGAWFRGLLDQPHQAVLFGKWLRNPSNYFTATFTYRTGRPFSAPRSGFVWEETVIPYFDGRNNVRLPEYHRLDIGYTYDQSVSKINGLRYILQFSIYNVYARDNALSIYFRRNQNGRPTAYQFSPIGSAIPSIQLTFLL